MSGGRSRRDVLALGAAGAGLLAGCSDRSRSGVSGGGTPTGTPTPGAETPYTVAIEPVGEVTFESVPGRWISYKMGYADMGFALGLADRLVGLDRPGTFLAPMRELFYDQLPGVSIDTDAITNVRGEGNFDKELFYDMDADVHLTDPRLPTFYWGWSGEDVTEIAENVGPFFGSYARRELPRDYEFYTLYEAFEKISRVFRRHDRFEPFAALHEEVRADIDSRLPPAEERPAIALISGGSDPEEGTLHAMDPTRGGYETKQYRDLGVRNALDGITDGAFTRVDYETLLEVDPETIVFHWTLQKSPETFREEFVAPLETHPVGSELSAVEEGEVYRGGAAEQGPIISLFQTELFATQQYPERFGEFPGFGAEPSDPLFDRERVAAIVRGEER